MQISKETAILRSKLKLQIKHGPLHQTSKSDEVQYGKLMDLLKRTILYHESNSILLIGPPGSGKTFMIRNILAELHGTKQFADQFCVVQLNGLLHTDDKLALKHIIKTLSVEINMEDCSSRSFAENLNIVLECFKNKNSMSLIFILDEFELFCAHHNQSLLYNLFDVAQSAQSPLFVLGVTSNISVVELLEKRVKSRFSHRRITVFPSVENRLNDLILPEDVKLPLIKNWNKHAASVIENVQNEFQMCANLTKNHDTYTNILFEFVSLIDDKKYPTALELMDLFNNLYNGDSAINLLTGLSTLEICLLISIKHHWEIYDGQPFNFKMAYTRYWKFTNTSNGIPIEPRKVAIKAFQHIAQIEFIVPLTKQLQFEHLMFRLNLNPDQITAAIKKCVDLPTNVAQWAVSSVV